jgi:hypothetical protein
VKEEEFPEHLQGQTFESALVEEFEQDIDQFRGWILESPVVTVIRHTGDSRGELGVGVKKNVGHEAIRTAIPGLAYEIGVELRDAIVKLGYTSVLSDRGKHFLLFGPLALVQSGIVPGVELGAVQGTIDWTSSAGTKFVVGGASGGDGIRLTKLKTIRKVEPDVPGLKRTWTAGEEVVVNYGPTPEFSEMGDREHTPQNNDEDAGAETGVEATAKASTPELARPKRGAKRPSSLSDFAEPVKRRKRRTAQADAGIPSVSVPPDSHEVFNVESSDEE